MYILLAMIGACLLGIAAHYLIDGRDLRGVAVTPATATALSAVVYTGLQWAGLAQDNPWLWVASILGSPAIAVVATVTLVAARRRSDAAKVAALGI
ncbi:hypothetical protein [Microbacterium sp. 179-I 3D4 NHS]|uniref:hypothetical protein n=1 Tax=Microbacterium sp. 179-I 3D4 NHS TaxID=3142381 RepID=UPI0039A3EADA